MARKKYQMDEKKIARFLKEKRGSGEGANYNPWLHVDDLPSRGRVHRPFCSKTGRMHHLLSDNEYYTFFQLWWDDKVIDIREQFPLINRHETLEIAALCGIRHPVDPISQALWVITTDFLVTKSSEISEISAIAVKEEEELSDDRTIDKLEIERRYWERRGVPWHIITDREVKCRFTRNLAWILKADQTLYLDVRGRNIDAAVKGALISVQCNHPQMPVRLACIAVDRQLGYRPGTALAALRRLLGAKLVFVDLHAKLIQELPVQAFSLVGGASL